MRVWRWLIHSARPSSSQTLMPDNKKMVWHRENQGRRGWDEGMGCAEGAGGGCNGRAKEVDYDACSAFVDVIHCQSPGAGSSRERKTASPGEISRGSPHPW